MHRWLVGEFVPALSQFPGVPRSLPPSLRWRANFDPAAVLDAGEARRVPRMFTWRLAASREAIASANFRLIRPIANRNSYRRTRHGGGGGRWGWRFVEDQYPHVFSSKAKARSTLINNRRQRRSQSSVAFSNRALHRRGPIHVLSNRCASRHRFARLTPMLLIRIGIVPSPRARRRSDAPISPGILTAFRKMRVGSTRPLGYPQIFAEALLLFPYFIPRSCYGSCCECAFMFVLEGSGTPRRRGLRRSLRAGVLRFDLSDAFRGVQIAPDVIEPVSRSAGAGYAD